jgi:hypothetical protein
LNWTNYQYMVAMAIVVIQQTFKAEQHYISDYLRSS